MNTGHLFAGAGGGLLADRILGHDPIFAVEQSPYCCAVLRERAGDGWFPNLHVHETDIRVWDPSRYAGRVDCLHAGFPCQDISVAGKGAGIKGARSGLWSEVVRCACLLRPKYLFLENSPAIVVRGLDTVLADLAALGYDARWCCLRASDVGAPHHRDRWWCLADANSQWKQQQQRIEQKKRRWSGDDGAQGNVADAKNHLKEWRRKRPGRWKGLSGEAHSDPRRTNLQGNDWWRIESNMGRVADGVAHRVHRLGALGNGQVPLQAAIAWKILIDEDR